MTTRSENLEKKYSRQILFEPIGEPGQRRLKEASVLIVGVGALGSVAAEILARAGVGRLRIVDRDYLDETNLQRQSLFDETDLAAGLPKAVAAKKRLGKINSDVEVEAHVEDLHAGNALALAEDVSLILDGTDNFETRYLLNDLSCALLIPWIYSACVSSYGMSYVVLPGETPCLRCLLEEEPPIGTSPTCDTAGVIAPIVHAVSSFACSEALKILAGRREDLTGVMWTLDVWKGQADKFRPSTRRKECPACGDSPTHEYLDGAKGGRTLTLCGRNAVQVRPAQTHEVDLEQLASRLDDLEELTGVRVNAHLLRFSTSDGEVVVFADGRAIVHGTDSPAEARSLYSKYVGS